MNTLEAAIGSCRNRPDKLYAKAFLWFQAIFGPSTADVSKIQLLSYLPEQAWSSRIVLGSVITGALVAMLHHRANNTGDWSNLSMREISTYSAIMPPALVEELDIIILEQAKTAGAELIASDLVFDRILAWQKRDYRKTKRWLAALDKAARVNQGMASVPLNDPFLREVKKKALDQLRPLLERIQRKFQTQRTRITVDDIVKAFEGEASNPSLPWLSNPHNLARWLEFCRSDPFSLVNSSPAQLFDGFAAFDSRHQVPYTRQKYSSKK